MPVGPVIIVNGPIRRAIGMNSGGNVLGQGNRANLTIGRAAAARHPQRRRGTALAASIGRRTATPASSRSASRKTRRARRGSRCRSSGASRRRLPRSRSSPARVRAASSISSRATPTTSPTRSRRACAPCTIRSCRSGSTRSSSSVRSTPECSREAGWSKQKVKDEIHGLLQLRRRRDRAGRRRHRRRHPGVPEGAHAAEVPSRRLARRARRAVARACSLPSSVAGRTERSAASRRRGR